MIWRQIYPEGSTVIIGRDRYTAKHNPHFPGIDLYQGSERVMTVCPVVAADRYRGSAALWSAPHFTGQVG